MDLLLFGFLVCLSAFFSGSETAMFSIGKVARARLEESERKADALILDLLSRPRDLLITVLFGNEITNIGRSIVSAGITARLLAPEPSLVQQSLLSAAIVVPILLIVGEVTPKTVAAQRPEWLARLLVRPLYLFGLAVRPARFLLRKLTGAIVRTLGGRAQDTSDDAIEEAEFRTLIDVGVREGVVDPEERTLIHNVLDFGDLRVADVMRPVDKVFCFSEATPIDEAISLAAERLHSRIPVWRGRPEQIIGMVHAKDLLAIRWGVAPPKSLRGLLRRPIFTLPQRSCTDLLEEFRRMRIHMAIVVDEFGRMVGICTMEDLLEELFGPITDSIHPPSGQHRVVRG